ncbi:MAG: LPS export ABC transporter periplasmic protein LptC [Thermodesulfobacteriota bacterium]
MKRAKIAILILIVVIAGIVLTSLWMNLQREKNSREKESLERLPHLEADMALERIKLVEDKQGKKTWELDAKAVRQYQPQNVILLEDVKVSFHTKEGRSFILSGDTGKVYQDSRNMELVGNVLLTSSDGYRLTTHSIFYQHEKREVTTSDPVEIDGQEIQVVGRGMRVDMEARIINILSQARTRWKGEKDG